MSVTAASKGKHSALLRELTRIAGAGTTAVVGAAVTSLSCGKLESPVGLNTTELFPMASTFKVPMACVLLRDVDEGKLKLTDTIKLGLADARPGTGVLTMKLLVDGQNSPDVQHEYTIHELLETAMNDSDNAATDALIRKIGGPQRVTEYVRSLKLEKLTVTRGCLEHLRDRCGVKAERTPGEELLCTPDAPRPAGKDMVEFVAMLEGRMEVLPLLSLKEVDEAYDQDPRDQTTPEDMNRLLQLIWHRQAGLSEDVTRTLLDIMANCRTGKGRIPGRLPEHALQKKSVMHKTGSLGGRANDVGFIELPDDEGAIAIAIYIKGTAGPGQTKTSEMYAERDRVIADIARACYDFYLYQA